MQSLSLFSLQDRLHAGALKPRKGQGGMATRTRKNSLKGDVDLTCGETVSVFYPLTILGSKNPGNRVAIACVLGLRQDWRGAVVVDTLHLTRVATLYLIFRIHRLLTT